MAEARWVRQSFGTTTLSTTLVMLSTSVGTVRRRGRSS